MVMDVWRTICLGVDVTGLKALRSCIYQSVGNHLGCPTNALLNAFELALFVLVERQHLALLVCSRLQLVDSTGSELKRTIMKHTQNAMKSRGDES
jgi:hypothetical protein